MWRQGADDRGYTYGDSNSSAVGFAKLRVEAGLLQSLVTFRYSMQLDDNIPAGPVPDFFSSYTLTTVK